MEGLKTGRLALEELTVLQKGCILLKELVPLIARTGPVLQIFPLVGLFVRIRKKDWHLHLISEGAFLRKSVCGQGCCHSLA